MDLDELIIIRNISDNYNTTPNKFMKEHPIQIFVIKLSYFNPCVIPIFIVQVVL